MSFCCPSSRTFGGDWRIVTAILVATTFASGSNGIKGGLGHFIVEDLELLMQAQIERLSLSIIIQKSVRMEPSSVLRNDRGGIVHIVQRPKDPNS